MSPLLLAELATEFHQFSMMHGLVVVVCFGTMALACWAGLHWRGTTLEKRGRMATGIAALVLLVVYNWIYLAPGRFNVYYSLPLHVCDIAGWIAAFALIFEKRWLKTTVYYFGLVLSSQAFIQPVLVDGPAYATFWCFWGLHLLIVGVGVYAVAALNYRPTWRDFWWAILAMMLYTAVMMPANAYWGLNYGYIGPSKPDRPTLIDVLGPWPLRVLWMALMAAFVFAIATAMWARNRRRAGAGDGGVVDSLRA